MKIEGENKLWEANLICLEAGQEHDAPQQCFIKKQDLSSQAKVGFSFILQPTPSFQCLSFLPSTAREWVVNKAQHLAYPFPYISKEFSPCPAQDWAFIPPAGTGGFWLLEILEMKGMGKVLAFFFSFPPASLTRYDWGAVLRLNLFDQTSHFAGNVVKTLFKIYS